MSERLADWERRLVALIHEAGARRFDARRWNCGLFAADSIEAVTGQKMPRRLRGTLEETMDRLLPRVEPRLARRGDVVLVDDPEPTLGVCVGRSAAFVASIGLHHLPMSRARVAWRV